MFINGLHFAGEDEQFAFAHKFIDAIQNNQCKAAAHASTLVEKCAVELGYAKSLPEAGTPGCIGLAPRERAATNKICEMLVTDAIARLEASHQPAALIEKYKLQLATIYVAENKFDSARQLWRTATDRDSSMALVTLMRQLVDAEQYDDASNV